MRTGKALAYSSWKLDVSETVRPEVGLCQGRKRGEPFTAPPVCGGGIADKLFGAAGGFGRGLSPNFEDVLFPVQPDLRQRLSATRIARHRVTAGRRRTTRIDHAGRANSYHRLTAENVQLHVGAVAVPL